MGISQTRIRVGVGQGSAVDVWSAASDGFVGGAQRVYALLSARERQRAAEYRCSQSRAAFVAGRAMLRLALSEYTQMDPCELRFGEGKNGKVELRHPMECAVQFSLAHADGLTLIAVACDSRVGIDVERIRSVPEADQIVARFASPGERDRWRAVARDEREYAFFRWWTRKEAYLKATGEGLSGHLDAFDVPLTPGDEARYITIDGPQNTSERWSLIELAPLPGYLATVAIECSQPIRSAATAS